MPTLEVVYAPSAAELWHVRLSFVPGMTVADALNQSAIFEHYPEARELSLGIFSKRASYDTVLRPGDRIELYRPLISDPKDARRKRALARQKALKQRP